MNAERAPSSVLIALIKRLEARGRLSTADEERLSEAQRMVLRDYRRLVADGHRAGRPWRRAACRALKFLGGDADRRTTRLADYDHRKYGPFLGVSDDGRAAEAVRRAARTSPKAQALGVSATALSVGVALDAERLGAVGEVPVGIDEYADIWLECAGQILITANVGSRVNLRNYQSAPLVRIADGEEALAIDGAKEALRQAFEPFLKTPDGVPRPLTVFVEFDFDARPKRPDREQRKILKALVTYVRGSGIAAPGVHRLGLNQRIGWKQRGFDSAIRAIDMANAVRLHEVSLDGVVRKEAQHVVSLPGLLNVLEADFVSRLLLYAKTKGVKVRPRSAPDPDTIARSIWASLNTTRAMGLSLGKYGLVPLTLSECSAVIKSVQRWFPDWTAAPVFCVDQGIVDGDRAYVGKDVEKGVERWLRMVARHNVAVVLIDTMDKAAGWKVLRDDQNSRGLLTENQIARLCSLGEDLGIKILWAGGITPAQVPTFGRLGVFGIYVTTAVADVTPVTWKYRRDPGLATEKRPTFNGVLRTKVLLEGSFLGLWQGKWSVAEEKKVASALPRRWRRHWTGGQHA